MKKEIFSSFVSPKEKKPLSFNDLEIRDGLVDLLHIDSLSDITKEQKRYYDHNAEQYDDFANITFAIQNENEEEIRRKFVEWLEIKEENKVLDLSCGTGRDSVYIAEKLKNGSLFCVDISEEMLRVCKNKIDKLNVDSCFCLANAEYLPFKDNTFDRLISFGGLNVFGDIEKSLKEIARVVKPGGKVLVGDESMPPWLYDTEFGKILLNNNPLFKFSIPLSKMPVDARNVVVRWIIGGVYYVIQFDVGEGEPKGNFDFPIPGLRGGTLNTRYYGKLEGVLPDIKEKIYLKAKEEKKSVHEWLNENLIRILGEK